MKFVIAFLAAACASEIIFFLVTLLMPCRSGAEIRLSKDRIDLKIKSGGLPLLHFFIKIRVRNLYTGEETELKTGRIYPCKNGFSYSAELKNARCGALTAEITEARFGFMTCFFRKKAAIEAYDSVLIMPEPIDLCGAIAAAACGETLDRRSASGLPDGAREYRSGDRLGDIHMKLSAKAGKYMVRERFGDGNGALTAILRRADSPDTAEKNARLMLAVAADCFLKGVVCRVLCGKTSVEMNGEWELESGFYRIFSADFSGVPVSGFAQLEISDGEVRAL